MAMEVILFMHLAQIIIAAAIVSALMNSLKQPNLFAYIIAGIILGPLVFGQIDFVSLGLPTDIGIKEITPEIMLLSELGAAFLLFSIGIETSIKRIRQIGKPVLFGTIMQVAIIIGTTIALTVPFSFLSIDQALFIGAILAFSSTMIVVKILSDKGEIDTLSGRLMVSVLLLQDFIVILLVPLLENIAFSSDLGFMGWVVAKSLVLVGMAILLNKYVFPLLFRVAAKEQELFFLSSIATAFFFISVSFMLSIPIAIGAFIGGLALSTLPYNLEIFSKIRALRDFFITIFFVSLGVQLSFAFGAINPALMAILVMVLFAIKPITLFLLGLFSGYGSKISVVLGLNLAQASEFGFKLVGIGLVTRSLTGGTILDADLASFLITLIAISMIVTPYIANTSSKMASFIYKGVEKLPHGFRRPFFNRRLDELTHIPNKKDLSDHIVIVGGGTVGRGLARALGSTHKVVVVDYDPEVVKQGQKDGLTYIYGTSENEAVWDRVAIQDAKLLVVTILRHSEAINIIRTVKRLRPNLAIFATAHYFSNTLDFYKSGVDFVSMPSIIGSNIFLENISKYMETGKLMHIQNFRTEYLSYLERQVQEEKKYKSN
ncbi:MAG: cation:proton antiporter [archaeon]